MLGDVTIKGDAPDWWGEIPPVPIGNNEDRYVAAVEIREVNDVLESRAKNPGRQTVGGRYIFHHMIWSTVVVKTQKDLSDDPLRPDDASFTTWPVHEVGRNADTFDPDGARILPANSTVLSNSVHLHSNGIDTNAHLEIGWKFHPKGYVPKYKRALRSFGDAVDIDIKAMEANQELHAYLVLPEHTKITSFEPHLHAPGARMCLEAIWGTDIETLCCSGLRPQLGAGLRVRGEPRAAAAEGHHPPHHRLHGQLAEQPQHPRSAQLAGLGQPVGLQHVHRPRPRRRDERRAVPGGDEQAARVPQAGPERSRDRLPAVQLPCRRTRRQRRRRGARAGLARGRAWRSQSKSNPSRGAACLLPSCLSTNDRHLRSRSPMPSKWTPARTLTLAPLAMLLLAPAAGAQSLTYTHGQNVAPAYEGWEVDAAGKKYFLFGYMNRNWEEEVDVPLGPDNVLAPGPADQGQPTHFLPRRNRLVFRIPVPDGFTDKDEVVWTLTTKGKTEKAYASLRMDYFIDDLVKASERGALGAGSSDPVVRSNKGPTLALENKATLSTKVGQPVTLVAKATDDGIPAPHPRQSVAFFFVTSDGQAAQRQRQPSDWSPPYQVTVDEATGLWVSCYQYRGAGKVTFDPQQILVWEDSRTGANSPWAPYLDGAAAAQGRQVGDQRDVPPAG